jgi:hypothetical protein
VFRGAATVGVFVWADEIKERVKLLASAVLFVYQLRLYIALGAHPVKADFGSKNHLTVTMRLAFGGMVDVLGKNFARCAKLQICLRTLFYRLFGHLVSRWGLRLKILVQKRSRKVAC